MPNLWIYIHFEKCATNLAMLPPKLTLQFDFTICIMQTYELNYNWVVLSIQQLYRFIFCIVFLVSKITWNQSIQSIIWSTKMKTLIILCLVYFSSVTVSSLNCNFLVKKLVCIVFYPKDLDNCMQNKIEFERHGSLVCLSKTSLCVELISSCFGK